MAGTWTQRLAELGIELPPVVSPVASYVPAVRTGNLVYTAGQLPIVAGELDVAGKVHEGA
ncbi:RidA family protein, partial [Streptomyces sp. SID10244]|nr:RidA family protein [Streptomyces sp. SID10244]